MPKPKKYYVTMTDKFLSGWGPAKDKKNKLVIECNTLKQAETVACNAKKRSEMKAVNIVSKKPYFSKRQYHVSEKDFKELGAIWKKKCILGWY